MASSIKGTTGDEEREGVLVKRLLRRVGVALLAGLALLLVYGVMVEPRFILDERSYTVELPRLGEEWIGAEIVVFADIQVGMWLANTHMVERVVARVVDAEPAAVLLAGDFAYSGDPEISDQVDKVIDLLAPLADARIPTYAVMGNHDYAVGAAEELTVALEQQGIEVLLNEAAAIPASERDGIGQELYVVGVGPYLPGMNRPEDALAGVPEGAPRVVFMHNPRSFPEIPPEHAPLAVAAHTHCGQIALPGVPRRSYMELVTGERQVVVDGFAPEAYGASGNRLFVTCGIGFSLVPIRIGAPPQLVFFKLSRAS